VALDQFSDEPWPAEGRRLGEIIERLVGPEPWARLLHWTGEAPGTAPDFWTVFDFCIAHDLTSRDQSYRKAVADCLQLLDAWNSGDLVAKARPGDPFAPLIDIPPPRAGSP